MANQVVSKDEAAKLSNNKLKVKKKKKKAKKKKKIVKDTSTVSGSKSY